MVCIVGNKPFALRHPFPVVHFVILDMLLRVAVQYVVLEKEDDVKDDGDVP